MPHPTNQLNCLSMDIEIAPHTEKEITATCTAPFAIDIVALGSHAHQYLERFETRIFDGQQTLPDPIYVSEDWDSPQGVNLEDAPLHLEAGQGFTFTCHYRNDTNATVTYGLGIDKEMCATMNHYAYPADRPFEVPPSLGTFILDNNVPMATFDTTDLPIAF